MDTDSRLHEKHKRISDHGHDNIPEITFREFDHDKDMFFLSELYWQFCFDVNNEDTSTLREFDIGEPQKVQLPECQARIYGYLAAGNLIQLAFLNNVLAGFLLYQPIFGNIIAIRATFIEKWADRFKLGKGLINSLRPIPKHLIFQSRKELTPQRMLKVTEPHRVKLAEDEHFITWQMPWRSNGNSEHHGRPTINSATTVTTDIANT